MRAGNLIGCTSAAAHRVERPIRAVVPSSEDNGVDYSLDRSSACQRRAPITAQSSVSVTVAKVALTLDRGLAGLSPGATGCGYLVGIRLQRCCLWAGQAARHHAQDSSTADSQPCEPSEMPNDPNRITNRTQSCALSLPSAAHSVAGTAVAITRGHPLNATFVCRAHSGTVLLPARRSVWYARPGICAGLPATSALIHDGLSYPAVDMPQVQHSAALASAPARGFATGAPAPAAKESTVPAAKPDFNWDELEESAASDNGKRELQLLRSTFMDVQQKIGDMTKVSRDAGCCVDPLGLPPRGCVQSIHGAGLQFTT